MLPSSLSQDARILYTVLPENGSAEGNIYLRNQFGWEEEYYEKLRDELESAGLIVRGRGRGGSIARALPPKGTKENT